MMSKLTTTELLELYYISITPDPCPVFDVNVAHNLVSKGLAKIDSYTDSAFYMTITGEGQEVVYKAQNDLRIPRKSDNPEGMKIMTFDDEANGKGVDWVHVECGDLVFRLIRNGNGVEIITTSGPVTIHPFSSNRIILRPQKG